VTSGVLSIISTVLLLGANVVARREERARETDAHAAAE